MALEPKMAQFLIDTYRYDFSNKTQVIDPGSHGPLFIVLLLGIVS